MYVNVYRDATMTTFIVHIIIEYRQGSVVSLNNKVHQGIYDDYSVTLRNSHELVYIA